MTDEVVALLHALLPEIVAELRAEIRAELRAGQAEILAELRAIRSERTVQVEPPPDAANVRLLQAIHAACGEVEKVFTCASLVQDADPDLRAAIVGAVHSLKTNKLGKRLSAIAGQNIGGLAVHYLGERSHVALWSVKGVGGV
jgi:hypothetical protein